MHKQEREIAIIKLDKIFVFFRFKKDCYREFTLKRKDKENPFVLVSYDRPSGQLQSFSKSESPQ